MTDWVPGDWGTIKTGQDVRLVPKNSNFPVIEGKAAESGPGLYLHVSGLGWTQFQPHDYDLFVPVPTQPQLPKVFGWYTDAQGRAFHSSGYPGDRWAWWGDSQPIDASELEPPFTRLLPEAETAKKIIEMIDGYREVGEVTTLGQLQALIVAEFGVSLD